MTRFKLISADSHVSMPDAAWPDYLDPEYRDQAPRIESTDEGDVRVFQGERTPIPSLGNMAGKKVEEFSSTVRRLSEVRSGAWDPVERINDQDIDGVDAEILYLGSPLVNARDTGLRLNSFRGYNRWLADFCSYAPQRLIGMEAVPVDSPEIAIEEMKAAVGMGLPGVTADMYPAQGNYSDPEWRPFFRALVDQNIPLCLHIGRRRDGGTARMGPGYMVDATVSKLAMAEVVADLIFGYVLQDFPDLKIVSVEAQIGWISFALYYMDHLFDKHRYWTKSELKEHPSAYFARQVWATFMEDPVGLRERHAIGVDRLMWANDYPHSETTWPNSKSLTGEWADSFEDEERDLILWKNCATLYGLS
jgi:predicted TIM-barrel fold metal-dependent hydrolase